MGSIWHREAYHDKFCSIPDPVGKSPLDFSIQFTKLSGSALKCIQGLSILTLSTAKILLEFPLLFELLCWYAMSHYNLFFCKPAKVIPLKVKTDDIPVLKSPWGFPGTRTCKVLLFFPLETFLSLLMSTSKFSSVCWEIFKPMLNPSCKGVMTCNASLAGFRNMGKSKRGREENDTKPGNLYEIQRSAITVA